MNATPESEEPAAEPEPARATRRLGHHARQSPREVLAELADAADPELEQDHYGTGAALERLETRVAELLGKEAAVFMPSGTMAQQIALRLWCDRSGIDRIAFHPTCHLELHEEDAYRRLHGLSAILLGNRNRLFTLDDLEGLSEPVAAILFELPQREIGGQLPRWDDLVAMTGWARERGIALHLDGARLWETKPFYDRPYVEIAGLFDSVYVSFYKILGGIAGAALAGPKDMIDSAKVWQRRHGGTLIHLYPLALSAELGLDRHLDRMGEYHDKAVAIAGALASLPGISVVPDPPHTNMMHVFITGDADRLSAASRRIIAEHDIELFWMLHATDVPDVQRFELTVGSSAADLDTAQVRELFETLLGYAES